MKNLLYFPLFIFLLTTCNNNEKQEKIDTTQETKTMTEEINNRPLEKVLTAKKDNFEQKASDEKKKLYAEGIQDVRDNDVVNNALQVGDKAKDFTLINATGKKISLYKELEKSPVILMWYRGGWCPYCNLTLHEMQESLPEFKKYNAILLALTPELPDSSISSKEKNALEFEVLSDLDNKVAHNYNIVFKLIEGVATAYENGFILSNYNGNTKAELPLAATYIIGQDKIIKFSFLNADYRNRAEPADLIEFLKNM